MRIRAPATGNLSLRVVGKRRDGYHLIDTIIAPVSLYDEIEIARARPRAKLSVACDDPKVPSGEKNLAYKAAALLLGKDAAKYPVAIHIKKRIPAGAGLGGGSSDAAAVLVGLNRLLKLKKNRRQLLRLPAEDRGRRAVLRSRPAGARARHRRAAQAAQIGPPIMACDRLSGLPGFNILGVSHPIFQVDKKHCKD